ncbi:tyrosine-type recombinase/integrase [Acidiferrobacter sp.]|uniref:tyrosine-type recombinase/integrase n=1 Tax=Acidiferrobacter sp. TaxID=1872107 RepID=UPI0026197A7B|nr:tyrosine-type recombinase/integrase [Acidiferrobacter sp.]
MKRFRSRFGHYMKRHLLLRRSLGYILRGAEYTLSDFDRYVCRAHPRARQVTRKIVAGYLETTRSLASKTRCDRLTNVRQFCRFLFLFDPETYIPEARLLPVGRVEVKAHLYTEAELGALMHEARQLYPRDPLVSHTYVTILGLLWVTGLRISEVRRLDLDDADLEAGVLTIRESKFKKSRLVPLHRSSCEALRRYREHRLRVLGDTVGDRPFFVNRRRRRFTNRTLLGTIQVLARRAGVLTLDGRPPRVHDFRHAYATRMLAQLYRDGQDPLVRLPILATFLGHANIANTQVYLHPPLDLLAKAGERFAAHVAIARRRTS